MSGIDWSTWLLLAQAAKQEAAPAPAPEGLMSPPVLLGILLLMGYMLLWRPEQKKRQEARSMVDNLKERDRVVTIGGIHGIVTNVQRDADVVTIRVDESTGTKIRVNTGAISRVVVDDAEPAS